MRITTDSIKAWSSNYTNWLPVIQWIGWIIITVISANLFWLMTLYFSANDVSNQKVELSSLKQVSTKSASKTDVNRLINRHLFGNSDAPVEVPQQIEVERETQLNLKLRGIYAANNQTRSNSIIEDSKGKQAVYFIDDKLQVSGRVYLRQVYPDKVILETNGVREVLKLDDVLPGLPKANRSRTSSAIKKRAKVDDKRRNVQISRSLNRYKKQLQDDPLSLVGLINYKPKMDNGRMIGIQISAGKDKRLFTQLGLRARDVITSINGVSLDDPQNALQLMADLQNMQELQVDINRSGGSVSLLLNLNPNSNTKAGIR